MGIKFTDNSAKVLEALNMKKTQALLAIGAAAEGHAKALTPVDTGRLRNSMSHAASGDAAYIGTNVEYAPYVEFGSVHNKAHHMLQKAATGHTAEYKAIAKAALSGK
jgi:HK97 gp10 family phage protein